VFVALGMICEVKSALILILSVSASPTVIFPPRVMLPVTSRFPLIVTSPVNAFVPAIIPLISDTNPSSAVSTVVYDGVPAVTVLVIPPFISPTSV